MTGPYIVTICFAGLLLVVLVVAFFLGQHLTHPQAQILRLLASLASGFAGGLLTGEAFFKMDWKNPEGMQLAVTGTAGCALFFAIWFTFRVVVPSLSAIVIQVPDGWTFRQAVDTLAENEGYTVVFRGITSAALDTPLRSQTVRARDISGVIAALSRLAPSASLPAYTVTTTADTITVNA